MTLHARVHPGRRTRAARRRGVLRAEKNRVLGLFPSVEYDLADTARADALRAEAREVLAGAVTRRDHGDGRRPRAAASATFRSRSTGTRAEVLTDARSRGPPPRTGSGPGGTRRRRCPRAVEAPQRRTARHPASPGVPGRARRGLSRVPTRPASVPPGRGPGRAGGAPGRRAPARSCASRKRRTSPERTCTTAVPSGAWNSSTVRS